MFQSSSAIFRVLPVAIWVLFGSPVETVWAQDASQQDATAATDAAEPLTLDELKILAARIALYPDDLVALCVAASLYPLQIVQAARFLEDKKKTPDLEPSDKWDGSIISLSSALSVLLNP